MVGSIGMCSLITSGSTFDPTMRCQMRIISMPCGFTNGVSRHATTMRDEQERGAPVRDWRAGGVSPPMRSRPSAGLTPPARTRNSTPHPATARPSVIVPPSTPPCRFVQSDVERDQPREPPRGAAAALVVDDAHHRPAEQRDGEHVRADEVVERADEEAPADHERRERPAPSPLADSAGR